MVSRKLVAMLVVALFFSSLSFAVTDDEKGPGRSDEDGGYPSVGSSANSAVYTDSQGTGRSYSISSTGKKSADLSASIAVFGTEQEPQFWMKFIDQELDVQHSSYQGRDAEISTYGENPQSSSCSRPSTTGSNGSRASSARPKMRRRGA